MRFALRLAVDAGLIPKAPKFRTPRPQRVMRPPLSLEQIQGWLDATSVARSPRIPNVDAATWWRALVLFGYNTALRIDTLMRLEWSMFVEPGWLDIFSEDVCESQAFQETYWPRSKGNCETSISRPELGKTAKYKENLVERHTPERSIVVSDHDLTKDERSLLMYLETRAVDWGGIVDGRRMNAVDNRIARRWNDTCFVRFGRLPAKGSSPDRSHWVVLSAKAMDAAGKLRAEKATRTLETTRERLRPLAGKAVLAGLMAD